MPQKRPNIVYVFADQWRVQDNGYAGNPQVKTPHLDSLAAQSVSFTHAVAGIPVCCPAPRLPADRSARVDPRRFRQ